MTDQHPITPPPKLIEDWIELSRPSAVGYADPNKLATLAAQWGADQELEACCEYMLNAPSGMDLNTNRNSLQLRATRRPKPASLKKQALDLVTSNSLYLSDSTMDIICRALEQLDD